MITQFMLRHIFDIHPIYIDRTLRHIIETRHQINNR